MAGRSNGKRGRRSFGSGLGRSAKGSGSLNQADPMTLLMIAAAFSAALALTSVVLAGFGTGEAPVQI